MLPPCPMSSLRDMPSGVEMRYFGSKVSTLPFLTDVVKKHTPTGELCDPFGGIGSVGSHFKRLGYRVDSGHLLAFASCFQVASIAVQLPALCSTRSAHLGVDGFPGVI